MTDTHTAERMTRAGFVLPRAIKPKPAYKCNVAECGAVFGPDEFRAWVRHTDTCFEKNRDKMQDVTAAQRMPEVFGPEAGDVEYTNWRKKHGWARK